MHYRPPVLQLQVAAEGDDGGNCSLMINAYVNYRPSVLQVKVASEDADGGGGYLKINMRVIGHQFRNCR